VTRRIQKLNLNFLLQKKQ